MDICELLNQRYVIYDTFASMFQEYKEKKSVAISINQIMSDFIQWKCCQHHVGWYNGCMVNLLPIFGFKWYDQNWQPWLIHEKNVTFFFIKVGNFMQTKKEILIFIYHICQVVVRK